MFLEIGDNTIELRPGKKAEVPLLLDFIRRMAAFENLTVQATEATLKEALFGETPADQTLLAFADGKPIAYVTYFFTFSTMVGKRGLWLDDLFIDPDYRGLGIGKAIMAHLARIGIENSCGRFEWIVLDWNTNAIRFYESLGAEILQEWRICRLDEAHLALVANRI